MQHTTHCLEMILTPVFENGLTRIIHDGSSVPHPSLPHTMGEGEGGGAR